MPAQILEYTKEYLSLGPELRSEWVSYLPLAGIFGFLAGILSGSLREFLFKYDHKRFNQSGNIFIIFLFDLRTEIVTFAVDQLKAVKI